MEKEHSRYTTPSQHLQMGYSLSMEQAKQLLAAAQTSPLNELIVMALTTGLRRGELLALRWQDVDCENELLHVRRFVYISGGRDAGDTARTIALPQIVLIALDERRRLQEEARANAGDAWHAHDLIFSNAYGQYLDPRSLRRQFTDVITTAGLPPMSFHHLRQSTAALLLLMGEPVEVVLTILGFRYAYPRFGPLMSVSLSMQRQAMQKWDALFNQ